MTPTSDLLAIKPERNAMNQERDQPTPPSSRGFATEEVEEGVGPGFGAGTDQDTFGSPAT
ncbi:MAG: hypothetical protein OXG81_09715 [Acidobacteria bacterium]|nr:hypothetical protein [Acidobacteriota bacterium]